MSKTPTEEYSWVNDPTVDDENVVQHVLREPQYARAVLAGRLLSDEHRTLVEGAAHAWAALGQPSVPPVKKKKTRKARNAGVAVKAGNAGGAGNAGRGRAVWVAVPAALVVVALWVGVGLAVWSWWPGLPAGMASGGQVEAAQSAQSAESASSSAPTVERGVLRAGFASFACQTDSERTVVSCFGAMGEDTLAPTVVTGDFDTPIKALGVGKGFGGLVDAEGRVWTWGASEDGQTGAEAPQGAWEARKVGMLSSSAQVSITAGAAHACVLADGKVWCWGSNKFGQVRGVPTPEGLDLNRVEIDEDVVSLGTSGFDMWATTVSGRMWGWGANNRGVLAPTDSAASLPLVELPDLALDGDGDTAQSDVETQSGRDTQ